MLSPGNLGVSSFGTAAPRSAPASWDVHRHLWFTSQPHLLPHPPWGEPRAAKPDTPPKGCSRLLGAPATTGGSLSHSRGCRGALTKSFSAPLPPAVGSQTRRAGGSSWRCRSSCPPANPAPCEREALPRGLPAVPTHVPSTQSPYGRATGAAGAQLGESPAPGWSSSRGGDIPTKHPWPGSGSGNVASPAA